MKKCKRLVAILCAFIMTVISLSGCGSSGSTSSASEETYKKDVVLGLAQLANYKWDPHIDWNGWYTVRYGLTETLFKITDDFQIEPWLADSYENVDNYTWKIKLKDGITFSTGKTVTGDDVVANLKRAAQINSRASFLVDAEYTVDGNTVTIKTQSACATFINNLADPYSSIIDLDGVTDVTQEIKMPVGTGPYALQEVVTDDYAKFAKNSNYWDGEPQMDTLTVKYIADMDTLAMALQSGEIDLAYDVSKDGVALFSSDSKYTVKTAENCRPYMIYMNCSTLSADVRKAINQAVDKNSICNYLLAGTTTAAIGPFSSKMAYSSGLTQTEYNVDACKATLSAAGYTDTDGDGFVDKDGKKLTIRLMLYARLSQQAIATEMQAELKKAGINCEVTVSDNRNYLTTGDFDLGMYTVATAPVGDSEAFFSTYVKTGASANYGKYSQDEIDSLITTLKGTFNTSDRISLTKQIEQKMLNDNAYMFIGMVNLSMVAVSGAENFQNAPCEYYYITKDSCIKE